MLGEKHFPVEIFIGLFIIAVIMSAMAIGNFFKISLDSYLPYIAWLVALGILAVLLPKNVGAIFLK
tara:strand:- start:527 stop:724 length:198 start_codon:yes stop_codon:yes gene_type:complete